MNQMRGQVDGNIMDKLMGAKNYDDRDLRTHIYTTPDTFAGSDKWGSRTEWILNFGDGNPETFKIIKVDVTTPYVISQCFVEIISNSADNITESRRINIPEHPVGKVAIEVIMNRQWITVKNYGQPIPVEVKEYTDKETGIVYRKWVPEYVMTKLLTSSNYDGSKTRHGAGKNGVGAKLTAIFSKQMIVIVVDGYRGKKYTQVVTDNMLHVHPPTIEDIEVGTESSTSISYLLDFERFTIDPNVGYSDEAIAIIANRVLGTSFTMKTPTSFNGVEFRYYHIKEYGRLIFGDLVEDAVIRYELDDPETEEIVKRKVGDSLTPVPVLKKGVPDRVIIPDTEMLIIDSAYGNDNTIASFVNSVPTIKGGAHVKKLYDVVIPPILNKINNVEPKVDMRKLKGKALRIAAAKRAKARVAKADAKKKAATEAPKRNLRRDDVKPYISGIICCRVDNPTFNSQTKVELAEPEPKLELSPTNIKRIYDWDIMDKLKSHLRAIKMYSLSKIDGKKVKNIRIKNGFDAYYAGTDRSKECVLWIVEGKSALAYAISLLSLIPGGRDFIGVTAIRGKFINVLKAEPERLEHNQEIKLLNMLLGLRMGVKYNIAEEFNTLRYGSVMVMADADKDGSHIKGLLANFFYGLYPELLAVGYLADYRTKFLKATPVGANKAGRSVMKFYTEWELSEWKHVTPDWDDKKAWTIDYYKGLGTAEKEDVKEDRENPKTVQFTYTTSDDKRMFDITFGKQNANARKEWIGLIQALKNKEYTLFQTRQLPFATFFNKEFIGYIMESLDRAIPNASDGMKRVHRQILHATMKHWGGAGPYTANKYKVAQFSGYVATKCEYQHNEECISKAIVIMARSFVGSNNIQLLMDRGQFGSRFFGGDDHASARYIHTNPSHLLYKIFRKEDLPILEYHEDDGKKVEPKAYFPIFPVVLANGCQGVATGYSTNVMNYNPIEVVDWFLIHLYNMFFTGGDPTKVLPQRVLVPWFKGYTGKITLVRDADDDADDEINIRDQVIVDDEENRHTLDDLTGDNDIIIPTNIGHDNTVGRRKFDKVIIEGVYEETSTGINVTEIPIGKWTINYNYFLQDLRDFKIIKDFKDNSTGETINVRDITGMVKPSLKKLGLIRRISLSNMVFLDEFGVPVRYNLIEDYMTYFAELRLRMYQKRKDYHLKDLTAKINVGNQKIRLIKAVKSRELVIDDRDLVDIQADMTKMGIEHKLLKEISLQRLAKEKIQKHQDDVDKHVAELKEYATYHPAQIWYKELSELRDELVKDETMIRTNPGYILTQKQVKEIYAPLDESTDASMGNVLEDDSETSIVVDIYNQYNGLSALPTVKV